MTFHEYVSMLKYAVYVNREKKIICVTVAGTEIPDGYEFVRLFQEWDQALYFAEGISFLSEYRIKRNDYAEYLSKGGSK